MCHSHEVLWPSGATPQFHGCFWDVSRCRSCCSNRMAASYRCASLASLDIGMSSAEGQPWRPLQGFEASPAPSTPSEEHLEDALRAFEAVQLAEQVVI